MRCFAHQLCFPVGQGPFFLFLISWEQEAVKHGPRQYCHIRSGRGFTRSWFSPLGLRSVSWDPVFEVETWHKKKRLGKSFIWLFFQLSHERLNKTNGMTGAASWLPNYTHEFVSPLSDLGKPVRASILPTDDHPNIVAGMVVWCEFLAKKKLGSERHFSSEIVNILKCI